MKTIKLNNETLTKQQHLQITGLITSLEAQGLEPWPLKVTSTSATISHKDDEGNRITMAIWSRNGQLVATQVEDVKQ